jgi:hypothetical protein
MPTNVLTALRASAPAASHARATSMMSVTAGVSFTHTGSRVRRRTADVTAAAIPGSLPNSIPPSRTFGQLMLISRPATPGTPSSRAASSP